MVISFDQYAGYLSHVIDSELHAGFLTEFTAADFARMSSLSMFLFVFHNHNGEHERRKLKDDIYSALFRQRGNTFGDQSGIAVGNQSVSQSSAK